MTKILQIGKEYAEYHLADTTSCRDDDKTVFLCKADKTALYFRFECEESYFYPKYREYNAPLYEGDIVELMITLGRLNYYLEVEVNYYNAAYCVLVNNRDGEGDFALEKLSQNIITSCVTNIPNGWACDIIIAKDELRKIGWSEDNCYFNAHRQSFNQAQELALYSLSPNGTKSFHKPKSFILMDLKEEQ